MTLYVFDTDHLSLYGRNHPVLIDSRKREATPTIATTLVGVASPLGESF